MGTPAFAYEGLDRTIHEPARLSILVATASAPGGRTFSELRELCGLSAGNLSRHLATLDEAGLVRLEREGAGRASTTTVELSAQGRRALAAYLAELERVLRDGRARPKGAKPLAHKGSTKGNTKGSTKRAAKRPAPLRSR